MTEDLVIRYRDASGSRKEQTIKTTSEAILVMRAFNNVGTVYHLYASDGNREVLLAKSPHQDK